MNTKTRLKRIEDQAHQRNTDKTAIRIIWLDPDGARGSAPFFEDERGDVIERETGEALRRAIRLHWPATPDLAGDDWSGQ